MGKVITVTLPDIGEGVVEGEVLEWLKGLNDSLRQDEPVVVVMTDKATVELPAPCSGKLVRQYLKPGEIAMLKQPLYDIETAEEATDQKKEKHSPSPRQSVEKPKSSKVINLPQQEKALSSPPVRKLAHDLGIDINEVEGTGNEGHVTEEDLLQYCARHGKKKEEMPWTRFPGSKEIPLIGIRNLMAKRMAESHAQVPHFSYFEQVDATRLVQLRNSFREEGAKQGISVTYMPFLIKALSQTLKRFPEFNSSVDKTKNALIVHPQHNVGIAITTRDGLIVPVLKNVQDLSLQEVILAFEELKRRALKRELQQNEMKESTITISNFGVLGGGGLWATPIINFPEVAILAVAKIQKQPLVRNDAIVIRDVLNLSWSFDHRVIDGDMAVAFSHYFSTLLQNPAPLV